MRILVTGHKGYLGSALVAALTERGNHVVGLDVDLYAPSTVSDLAPVQEIAKDIRDVCPRDLEGIDVVMHLAALSNDPIGDLDPVLTYDVNYHSSVRLARLAKEAGVRRFIFSSSCSNYGAASGNMMIEESPLNPVTAYGKSKVLTEQAVDPLASDSFSPVFLRNATAYGVAPRFRIDLVVNNLTAWAFTTGRVRIMSDGKPWRPLVHVSDIAEAFVAVAEAPRDAIHNHVFNIGMTEENYQVRQVAEIVAAAVPGSAIEYATTSGPDSRDYRVCFDKAARQLTGFAPRWTVSRGVEQLLELYREIKLTADDITGARFARIARIKQLLGSGELDAMLRWTSESCQARDSR